MYYKSFYITPQQIIDFVKNKPLDFAPGTSYKYSNTGFDILALIVEKASGESFPDYIKKHITKPAGLNQTYHSLMQNIVPLQTSFYEVNRDTLYRADEWGNWGYGAGLIESTIDDLLKFQDALNKNVLLKPASLRQMRTPLSINGQYYPYGFGTRIKFYPSHTGYGHTGSGGGTTTVLHYFPGDDLTVSVLMNTENDNDPSFPTAPGIAEAIEKKILYIPTAVVKDLPIPQNEISGYTGDWISAGSEATIYETGGKLWLYLPKRNDSTRLLYQGNHKFILEVDHINVLDFQMKDDKANDINVYYDYGLVGTYRRKE